MLIFLLHDRYSRECDFGNKLFETIAYAYEAISFKRDMMINDLTRHVDTSSSDLDLQLRHNVMEAKTCAVTLLLGRC